MSETNQNDHTGIFRPAEGDTQIDLLMRHSSPYTRDGAPPSPMTLERNNNGSPSPLRLNRPRSNPRNRTPMRYASPTTAAALQGGGGGGGDNNDAAAAFRRIPEHGPVATRGITILPTAGRAVGTALAAGRIGFRQVSFLYVRGMVKKFVHFPLKYSYIDILLLFCLLCYRRLEERPMNVLF